MSVCARHAACAGGLRLTARQAEAMLMKSHESQTLKRTLELRGRAAAMRASATATASERALAAAT